MGIISTDSTTGATFTSSPETMIIKKDVLVYGYSNSTQSGTIFNDGLNNATLINYGHVVGDGVSEGVWFKNAFGCSVINAAGADIYVEDSAVIFQGNSGRLTNDGVISSDFLAVQYTDGGFLANSGTIRGQIGVNIKSFGFTLSNTGTIDFDGLSSIFNYNGGINGYYNITNSGTINGGFYFNPATFAATNTITNTGLIGGNITSSNLVDIVRNRGGHIAGSVSLGDSADSIDNRGGYIDGDVNLGAGADVIDNRGGHVGGSVSGGLGDDTYIIDGAPISIVENDDEGSDTVASSAISLKLADYNNIENITLLGGLNLAATGDEGNNILTGNAGKNVLTGGLGDDTYNVQNTADKVVEAANAGYDTVHSTVSYVLSANVEALILDGTAVSGTGNTLANMITGNGSANVLIGGAGADTLDGGGGNDTASYATAAAAVTANLVTGGTVGDAAGDRYVSIENLTGSRFGDNLTGDDNANVIDGGVGADTMSGGKGADVYYVDNVGDKVIEANRPGELDAVHSTISFSLGSQYVEQLYLDGTAAINGTGNVLNNLIQGNGAANVIEGGGGSDDLIGGGGADTFVYHAKFGQDFISDFTAGSAAGHDFLKFDKTLFADFAAVMSHAVETNSDGHYTTTITFDANNLILLDNVRTADLVSADMLFV